MIKYPDCESILNPFYPLHNIIHDNYCKQKRYDKPHCGKLLIYYSFLWLLNPPPFIEFLFTIKSKY